MRFVFYTEKTVAQCLTAINDRMQVKATSTRPALDGWVEKGGAFALSLTSPVVGKFTRRTTLNAQAERDSGITIVRGSVPSGAPREGQAVVFIALVLVALTIIGSGNVLIGLLLLPVSAYLYIPLHGDYRNSDVLLDEVQKTLKAKLNPPKTHPSVAAASAKPGAKPSAKPSVAPAKKTTAAEKKSTAPKPTRSTATKAAKPKAVAAEKKPSAAKSARSAQSPKPSAAKPRTTAASSAAPAEKVPASPSADEFPLFTESSPALPTPDPKPNASSASKPATTEKKPPPPPADEFPEIPGEAPP